MSSAIESLPWLKSNGLMCCITTTTRSTISHDTRLAAIHHVHLGVYARSTTSCDRPSKEPSANVWQTASMYATPTSWCACCALITAGMITSS